MITHNGRPAKLGGMYFDGEGEITKRRYCVGYCPKCKTKIGLTTNELREFTDNLPGFFKQLTWKLLKARIIVPD